MPFHDALWLQRLTEGIIKYFIFDFLIFCLTYVISIIIVSTLVLGGIYGYIFSDYFHINLEIPPEWYLQLVTSYSTAKIIISDIPQDYVTSYYSILGYNPLKVERRVV